MPGFSLEEIVEATGGKVILRGSDFFHALSIDSRTIADSELFIALRGARFDGHDFLDEALRKGAGAIVNYPPSIPVSGKTIICVKNTLRALQGIARYRREKRNVQVIGITGTNGKTTTKEMLCGILRTSYKVLCSSGNLNNQIGLPLNLLRLEDEDVCVLEMGASKRGDIEELCDIALPDYGIITNIGPGHLEGFGSLETVRDTKLELAGYARKLVVNGDDPVLVDGLRPIVERTDKNVITYAINKNAPVMARNIHASESHDRTGAGVTFDLCIEKEKPVNIALSVAGRFNVYNALAASAMAFLRGIEPERIKDGLERFEGVPMRLEIKQKNGMVVISDVYNANPASMEEAVKELVRIKKKRAVAVLGDMLELGSYAEEAHKRLGIWLSELPIEIFIGVGPLMTLAVHEFIAQKRDDSQSGYAMADVGDAKKIMYEITGDGDTILVKGSRGMNMQRILEENCAV